MTKQQPEYLVMPSGIEMTGRQLWFGSHELKALWDRLNENLAMTTSSPLSDGQGPAWGSEQIGQAYGPDYLKAMELIRAGLESYAKDMCDGGKKMVAGSKNYADLDDEAAKAFATEMVRSLPRTVEPQW